MPTKMTDRAVLIGARIVQARDDADLTTSGLARLAGLERNQLKRLMRGANEPRLATLERIASATGKSIEFFNPEARRSLSVDAALESLADALVLQVRSLVADRIEEAETVDEVVA